MRQRKRKTVWAYLDGKKLVNVVQAALDNNMMADDLKAQLVKENPGHEVGNRSKTPQVQRYPGTSGCVREWGNGNFFRRYNRDHQ